MMNGTNSTTDWSWTATSAEMLLTAAIMDPAVRVPGLTRNIRQLKDSAECLWARVGVSADVEARGNVFLCGRNMNAPLQVPGLLGRLGSSADEWPDADVGGFVRELVQDAMLGPVVSTTVAMERSVTRQQTNAAYQAWRAKKRSIMQRGP